MHFEILVEDVSGKKMLSILLPKILQSQDTFEIHSYRGIGRIPKGLGNKADPQKRILLNLLPKLLRGYGKTFSNYPDECPARLIVVCDLDDRSLAAFEAELLALLHACNPKPETSFCIAIEEGEAWFLGDLPAIQRAYPKAREGILNSYVNDAICGTWQLLADAIYPGGCKALSTLGWHAIGAEKSAWAETISPQMIIEDNKSPSFVSFCSVLKRHTD